jgi:hypothetical protein
LDVQNVKLLVPALDVLFISDIFNLFMTLKNIKPNIKWIFPVTPLISRSVEFESGQQMLSTYTHPNDSSIGITYVKDTYEGSRDFYDIVITDGVKTIYLAQYINATKAELLHANNTITEVHVPYSSTLYGGLSYVTLLNLYPSYYDKFVINSFISVDEYEYCKSISNYKIGGSCYYDII